MGKRQKAPDYSQLARANIEAARIAAAAHDRQTAAWEKWQTVWREDLRPWRETGAAALEEINEGMRTGAFEHPFQSVEEWSKNWQTDPGYQFRMAEGLKALRRSHAAGSGAFSGAANKRYLEYAQGKASEEFGAARARALQDYTYQQAVRDRHFNRLSGLAGTGQTATTAGIQYGQNALAQQGRHVIAAAEHQGSGLIGSANAGIMQQIAANQASQQNFNNLLQLGTAAAGLF